LYLFFERKQGVNYAPVFSALLGVMDEAAKALIIQKLTPAMPQNAPDQREWFSPYLAKVDQRMHRHYQEIGRNLQKTLVYKSGVSPLGLLRNCMDYALNDRTSLTGAFSAIKDEFRQPGSRELLSAVQTVNDFRNTRIAHQERPLQDSVEAKKALRVWVEALAKLWAEQVDASTAMPTSVELKKYRLKDEPTSEFIGEITAILPMIASSTVEKLSADGKKQLGNIVEESLQPLADYRFGSNAVRITCAELRAGSLELTIIISTGAAAAFQFIKDYDKVKANTNLLAADIKRISGRLSRILNEKIAKLQSTLN
jgi:hypothetical protein